MTNEEAMVEANQRWGHRAVVRDRGPDPARPRYLVGTSPLINLNNNILAHGEGSTWEEAFQDATDRDGFLEPYMRDE